MESNTMNGRSRNETMADTAVGRGCQLGFRAPGVQTGCLEQSVKAQAALVARPARPGSALILVLVSLVMMVLIGTAYIQVARVDRRATAQLTGVNNLDTVRDAVIAYMATVLKRDILDDADNFFNPTAGDEDYDYPFTNRDTGVTYAVTSGRPDRIGLAIPGAQNANSVGGRMDDTWLANTYVDSESRQFPAWNHLSNLNGIYLRMPKTPTKLPEEVAVISQDIDSRGAAPHAADGYGDVFVTGTDNYDNAIHTMPITGLPPAIGNANSLDHTQTGWQTTGVDADGDGILDSRWTWAPEEVRQIGSLTYVVAYRIIDMSSMLNVNVATAALKDGTSVPTGSVAKNLAPRGYYPTDLDLTRLLSRSRNAYASWGGEASAVLAYRGLPITLPANDTTAMKPGTFDISQEIPNQLFNSVFPESRAGAWLNVTKGARDYGFQNDRFLLESELELRSRGGLNTATDAEIENAMTYLLRKTSSATVEAAYKNVPLLNQGAPADRGVHSFMSGAPSSFNESVGLIHAQRNFPEIRHMLTTMSGTSVLAPRYNADALTDPLDRLQVDLSYRGLPASGSTAAEARGKFIYDRLERIFKIGTPKYANQTDDGEIQQIAAEFAANIQDYTDKDNRPTGVTAGLSGTKRYGLEVMPFIREFYVQAAYESDDPDPTTDTTSPNYKKYRKWKYKPGSAAYVIEIGNPFDKILGFDTATNGVSIRIRVHKESDSGNQNAHLATYDIPGGIVPLEPRNGSDTTEQLVAYSNGASPVDDGTGKGLDVASDLQLTTTYPASRAINLPAGSRLLDSAIDGTPISVELRVEVGTDGSGQGVFIAYDRLRDPKMQLKENYDEVHGDTDAGPIVRHAQISMMRDGRKIRYLSNKGRTVNPATPGPKESIAYLDNNTSVSYFGQDVKGSVTGDVNLDKIQLAHANHQIFNVAELAYIFMPGFYDSDLGDLPTRISGKDGELDSGTVATSSSSAASKQRWFLSMFETNGTTPIIPSVTKIPHMAMVMDQFTTLSPRHDTRDNDGDGAIDNAEETFVPGRFNVNTTPFWLMAMTSPIPESITDLQEFYNAITEYRDRPVTRANGANSSTKLNTAALRGDNEADKGIRSIGELMMIRRRIGTETAAHDMHRYANTAYTPASLALDNPMRPYPRQEAIDTAVSKPLASGNADEKYEAQERVARFQYLTNTLTTRSDMFCAYVVIRGYDSTDFSGTAAESTRFFVILDRSKVIGLDSSVIPIPKTGQKN